jgi:hypothetical protein
MFFSFVLDAFLSNEFGGSSTRALTYWMKRTWRYKTEIIQRVGDAARTIL